MIKPLIIITTLITSPAVFTEANISQEDASKTILLTAPGTISGRIKQPDSGKLPETVFPGQADNQQVPGSTTAQPAQRYNYPFYNFVEERDFKFPQYGQVNGKNNPWSDDEANRRLPPPLPPTRGFSSNPWDISGRNILEPNPYPPTGSAYRSAPYPSSPGLPMMPGFGGFNDFFPNPTDGIYRDTNPAVMGPFMNGMMPGLDDNSFDFPFSPFNMF